MDSKVNRLSAVLSLAPTPKARSRTRSPTKVARDAALVQDRLNGMSVQQLRAKYGFSRSLCSQVTAQAFDAALRAKVVEDRKAGMTFEAIARKNQIGDTRIRLILRTAYLIGTLSDEQYVRRSPGSARSRRSTSATHRE